MSSYYQGRSLYYQESRRRLTPGSGPVHRLPFEELTLESLTRDVLFLRAKILNIQSELSRTQETQAIQKLLSRYATIRDNANSDPVMRAEWESLFTPNGVAVFPHGAHHGRAGKAAWTFGPGPDVEPCSLLTSNFDVNFSLHFTKASVTSNCSCTE